jgi:EAL domain-containing protein (putative c-di-GMP-specific phosphodiesterase class I)
MAVETSWDTRALSPPRLAESDRWRGALRHALNDPSGLRLAYQPIVDLVEGAVVGYEALARFAGPPTAGPDLWFAAARRFGVAAQLEAKAIRLALGVRGDLPANCFLSINVSPDLLGTEPIGAVLDQAGDLGGVVIELTEHDVVDDLDMLAGHARELRRRGATVALDDAGAGYSGLQQMAAVRPGLIKLDRSLVDGIDTDPVKQSLADLLGRFASRLDAWILAEGVERTEELDTLMGLDIPLAQGYLFDRPAPAFRDVSPQLRERVQQRARRRDAGLTIAPLVEDTAVMSSAPAADNVACGPATVITDAHGRPAVLVVTDSAGRRCETPASMTALVSDGIAETLLAGLARSAAQRFDPIVCIDSYGAPVGVVRIERLASQLAMNDVNTTTPRERS